MRKYKKITLVYFLVIGTTFGVLFSAFYIYDPIQIFHKAWDRDITFHSNMRQQAAGIINNFDNYNSVIIGTSVLENTSSKMAEKQLGGEFINLSLSGSSFYERAIVLRSLFSQHKIEKIIYSLDVDKYFHQETGYPKYPISQFDYLYDNNLFNDFKIYANLTYLECLLQQSKTNECIGEITTLDRPNAWFENKGHSIRFGGLDKWLASKQNEQIITTFKAIFDATENIKKGKKNSLENIDILIEKAKIYIDKNILVFVKAEPNTHFILLDPPYSRVQYAIWAQYDLPKFEVYKAVLKYLAQKSDFYPNLEVYSFGEELFVDDIATYKDLTHYHYSINSFMLSAVKQKTGLLHEKTIDHYIDNISRKALSFDLINLNHKITGTAANSVLVY